MKSEIKKLDKSEIEITVELSEMELTPYLIKAAEKISTESKIEGFRPGKAPYDIVKQKFGEGAIMNEAVDDIISKSYYEVLKENEIVTIGAPEIKVEKAAPGNPFVYKAKVAVLPKVKLGDYQGIKLERKKIEIKAEQVEKVVSEITKLRASEKLIEREAKEGDKLEIDFDVFLDKVSIENGKQTKYPITIGEGRFIPGFEEQLIGMKAGEVKEFELKFPEKYYEKSLAGKNCEFKVTCKAVYEVEMPKVDDEFAKMVSGGKFSTVQEMKDGIKQNLEEEEKIKQDQILEIEMLDKVVGVSEFEELPEVLLHNEKHRMLHELEDSVTSQGFKFEDYLSSIKKTTEELENEFTPQAEKRVKTSIIAREIYQEQKIEVSEDEVGLEIEKLLAAYPNNPEARKQLETETYKDYLRNMIGNKKVIEYLKGIMVHPVK